MTRVFIVGSDVFLVNSMRFALRFGSGVNVVGVLDSESSVRTAVHDAQPHVVIIDGRGSQGRTVERLREVRDERPDALLVLVSDQLDDDVLVEAAAVGALVCLSTAGLLGNLQMLLSDGNGRVEGGDRVALVASASNGAPARHEAPNVGARERCPLTNRELEILHAVAEGHTNARIGRDLWVTEQTVKFHLSNIYRKLGVANRTQASRYALVNDLFAARDRGYGAEIVARAGGSVSVGANGNGRGTLDPAVR
jgi:DNA-binding NarL/FixJ family response regulator